MCTMWYRGLSVRHESPRRHRHGVRGLSAFRGARIRSTSVGCTDATVLLGEQGEGGWVLGADEQARARVAGFREIRFLRPAPSTGRAAARSSTARRIEGAVTARADDGGSAP